MEKLNYGLPDKAKKIIEELASGEMYQISFYLYLGLCLSNHGYEDASRYFIKESESERGQLKRLLEFLQMRGVEAEVPKVKQPDIEIEDLTGAIKAAYELEIATTEKYEESIKMIRDIDTMAYLKLCSFLESQQWSLEGYAKMWAVFGDLEENKAQKEQDVLYFGIKPDNMPVG